MHSVALSLLYNDFIIIRSFLRGWAAIGGFSALWEANVFVTSEV